ncbi:hypothetical protein SLS60_005866 [Paraconiothyrium brasiliense]|uniref:Uncharacterized protein n=1 Tax=Paraconiothyrium brasiliense TaxID=300254 RepID=A0ABR3RDD0_9PLEO
MNVSQFVEVTKTCFENVCASGSNTGASTERCGPIVLAITHLDGLSSDIETCVGHFRGILEQCASDGINGGTSQVGQALYDIFVVNDGESHVRHWLDFEELSDEPEEEEDKSEDDLHVLDVDDDDDAESDVEELDWLKERGITEDDDDDYDDGEEEHHRLEERNAIENDEEEDHEVEYEQDNWLESRDIFGDAEGGGDYDRPVLEARRTRGGGNRARTRPARTSRPKKATPKKAPTKKTTPKPKPKPKQKKKTKSCPARDQTGKDGAEKGKKTIRDVADYYIPRVISELLTPRGNKFWRRSEEETQWQDTSQRRRW